ncbi:MAG TPA: NHLP leader peptide family RiPP precursor [Oscillatoriaceae cyanobacterium]
MSTFTPAELQARLLQRASEDADFRRALLANPHEALRREFGIAPPPNLAIQVLEQKPGTLTLVLPPLANGELSEHELDSVAGGLNLAGSAFWSDFTSLFELRPNVFASGGVIPAGAGNVIAGGAGNVIAGGAGNVIAAGGGNFEL